MPMSEFKSFNDFRREQHNEPMEEMQDNFSVPHVTDDEIRNDTEQVNSFRKRKKIKLSFHGQGLKHNVLIGVGIIGVIILSLCILPIPLGQINLQGTNQLTLEDVIFEGEITKPVNVLQISSSKLEKQLRNDLRVESVSITRQFPLTINVNVVDRVPLAIIQGEFSYAYIDKNGVVIENTQALRKMNVPMITGNKLGNILLGDKVDDSEINVALKFLNGLTPEGIKVFSEVNIGNTNNIRAYTRDGIKVLLGNGTNIESQAKLAENMVGDVKARGLSVEYIDANFSSPFIKLKK